MQCFVIDKILKEYIIYNMSDEIIIYVDGSFYKGMYGGGYAVFKQGELIYQDCGVGVSKPELVSMRNITGEMTAAMHAAKWLYKNKLKGIIVHDYTGLSKWVTGEWQAQKLHTQQYRDYMRKFYNAGIIKFRWVKGHTGIEGNEIADRLAKQSIIHKQRWKL